MKKRVFCLLLVFCVVSLLFLGCRNTPADPGKETTAFGERETSGDIPAVPDAGFSENGPEQPSGETTQPTQAAGNNGPDTPTVSQDEQSEPTEGTVSTAEPEAPSSPDGQTPEQTQPADDPVISTEPEQTQPADDSVISTEPEQTQPAGPELLTYEAYLALDAYGKQDYFMSFPDWSSFFAWQESAIEEYEKTHSSVDADGIITLPVSG